MVPNMGNFRYYRKKRDIQRMKKIQEDLLEMWEGSLEYHIYEVR